MEQQEMQQEPILSKGQLLTAIFTNPSRAFTSLVAKPNWILPVIIFIIIGIAAGYLTNAIGVQYMKDKIASNEKLTEEVKDQALARLEAQQNSPFKHVQTVGGVLVFVFVSILFVAAVFLLTGNFILGGESNYKTMLAVYSWGSMVGVLESIVKIPMMLANNSIHAYTSLAVLFDPSQAGTAIFKFADAIDIFSLWRVALWAIGFGIAYKFSKGKSYTAIGLLYVIYVVLYVIISGLLSKLTGGMI